MKKIFLLLVILSLYHTNIHADDCCVENNCYYVRALGGYNWIGNLSTDRKRATFHTKPGGFGSIALGYHLGWDFSVEGEYFYEKNDVNKLTVYHSLPGVDIRLPDFDVKGSIRTQGFMVNVLANLTLGLCVEPYVGLGAGYAITERRVTNIADVTKKGIVMQLIAGIEYPFTESISGYTEYRFFVGHERLTSNILALGLGISF